MKPGSQRIDRTGGAAVTAAVTRPLCLTVAVPSRDFPT